MRFLIIEDDYNDYEILNSFLAKSGFKGGSVDHCESLSEAQKKLKKNSYDLIFVDPSLSDSFGYYEIGELKLKFKEIPMVIVTGFEADDGEVRALETGAEDYLEKNHLSVKAIEKAVNQAMSRSKMKNKLRLNK